MEDEPVRAIKRKKDSSMVKMAEAVKSGEADGCVSAGNTGALMSAGLFIVGRIKGVARPALVVTLPTTDGKGFVFLDVGANADAKAEHLLQYAQLGNIYAQKFVVFKILRCHFLILALKQLKNSLTKKHMIYLRKINHLNLQVILKQNTYGWKC